MYSGIKWQRDWNNIQFSKERRGKEILDLSMESSNNFEKEKCGCSLVKNEGVVSVNLNGMIVKAGLSLKAFSNVSFH